MYFMVYWKIKKCLSCLAIWEMIENLFYKNEVENLTNFIEVRLFKVFLKLLGYELHVSK